MIEIHRVKSTGKRCRDLPHYRQANDYSAISFKPFERKKLEEKGYTIIMAVGDQESDLKGGDTEHAVKIPNPMYVIP